MTKTLNHIIFFPPPKSEYFFQQHWESEYFFRKKPYPFKLNGRSLTFMKMSLVLLLSSVVLPLVNGVTSCKLFHRKDK